MMKTNFELYGWMKEAYLNTVIYRFKIMETYLKFGIGIILFLGIRSSYAEINLPAVISDGMVIQQDTMITIWGWAESGETVTVKGSWMQNSKTTLADEKGEWQVKLMSPQAGGPYKIVISGKNKIVLKDILSGEVWLASGQSNMAMPLKQSEDAKAEITLAQFPDIHFFDVKHRMAETPQADSEGKWEACTPDHIAEISAVAYYFARKIHTSLHVPVGVIIANKGGTPAESFVHREVLEQDTTLSKIFDLWTRWENEYPEAEEKYEKALDVWKKLKWGVPSNEKVKAAEPRMPLCVKNVRKPHRRPSALYNAMIWPHIPYVIKGVIWYQGENNVNRPVQYQKLFIALIRSWRKERHAPYLPFYYVQIAPWERYVQKNASLLREAQFRALSVPNTGMVVTSDIGNLKDIHPKNKKDVGERLALWAQAKTYGQKEIICSGPLYKSMKIEGDKIRLYFNYVGSGLIGKGDTTLTHFEIAGADKKYVKAEAVIDDSTVVVYNKKISNPLKVRFGWNLTSVPNFYNKEGLPASPFRTEPPTNP